MVRGGGGMLVGRWCFTPVFVCLFFVLFRGFKTRTAHLQTHTWRQRQTERQTDRQTDREGGRQTDRQRQRETEEDRG